LLKTAFRVLRLPAPERRRRIEAAFELTRASLELWLLPPASAVKLLGVPGPVRAEAQVADERMDEAVRTGRAVGRVAARLPWHPTCLRQAVAAQRMLRRRGIACTLHLGVTSARVGEAHAWVSVAGEPVVGRAGVERHVPLAAFQ
jgi:hypothetical protein